MISGPLMRVKLAFSSEATARAMVVLPPSPGKEVERCEVSHSSELSEVTQLFVDAIARSNGRMAPRRLVESLCPKKQAITSQDGELAALLNHLDPACGYQDWFQICAAIHHHTVGSVEGLELFDRWSQGGANYAGTVRIENMWQSLANYRGRPITIATICMMLKDQGLDPLEIRASACPKFDICETVVVDPAGGVK